MGLGEGDIVSIVAFIVSLVALVATFMQVLQQYYASAAGYSQCNEKVMGRWADSKKRRFSWDEMRFEVRFQVPVIFVSPPTNPHGPVLDQEILFLDGTPESLDKTWTDLDAGKVSRPRGSTRDQLQTTDTERASWAVLLSAVQRMESESQAWQASQYKEQGPPSNSSQLESLPTEPPSLKGSHTLTVALQRLHKSWDTMPASVSRPYATTTMCHLIEMVAALGIYWKEFDRTKDRYRAEGNGFMVLGEKTQDLGLMFSFRVYGKSRFDRMRVVPVDEIKELCFGYVPTIYRTTLDHRRLEFLETHEQNISTLAMATRGDISESLVTIGCNNNAVRCFANPEKRTSHLFPVAFEIVGMLGQVLHIEHSFFTYIPNPTSERWDKRTLSLPQLMQAYQKHLHESPLSGERNMSLIGKIHHHIGQILEYQKAEPGLDQLRFMNALHAAISDCDEVLTAKSRPESSQQAPKGRETERQKLRREMVLDVMRSHLQEVLRLLNEYEDHTGDNVSIRTINYAPPSPRMNGVPRPPLSPFAEMHAASPDERQDKFMEVYFKEIRQQVVSVATHSTGRRVSIVGMSLDPRSSRARGARARASSTAREDNRRHSMMSARSGAFGGDMELDDLVEPSDAESECEPAQGSPIAAEKPLSGQNVSHDDVWCTLVFRMICWLMLHDIHKSDVQVSKAELLGSRMPVYIA